MLDMGGGSRMLFHSLGWARRLGVVTATEVVSTLLFVRPPSSPTTRRTFLSHRSNALKGMVFGG
jgi:hypothetical protein